MSEPTQFTAAGLRELEEELAHLEGARRREISERIRIARDFGDLKENSEYHDAKNEQAFLETKIARLRERLLHAEVVDDSGAGSNGQAAFGSQVVLRDEGTGKDLDYRLVGPTEANLAEGKLSIESPVAQAVLGHRVGDTVKVPTPRGDRAYKLVKLS